MDARYHRRGAWLHARAIGSALGLCLAASAGAAHADQSPACTELQQRLDTIKRSASAIEISNYLFSAADKNCVTIARELLDGGASVDARDRFGAKPLSHAARFGNQAVVDLLLDRGAPIDARNLEGATALFVALDNGRGELARHLIMRGADIGLTGRSNITLLMEAAYRKDDTTAALLIDKGVDPDARDDTGKSAAVYAAARAFAPLVARLLDRGIDINARYGNDLTLLMWAAGYDDEAKPAEAIEVVRLALDRGAKLDDRDNRGRDALMIAAETGHAEVVDFLLAHGADPHSKDKAGKSAADLTVLTQLREKLSQ